MYQLPGTISPKVALPAWALAVLGVVCVLAGLFVKDAEPLVEVGIGLLAGAGIVLPIGYRAPPGTVVSEAAAVASDDLLAPEAQRKLQELE